MFTNKIVLVTGGTGSIGSEIVRNILSYNPKALRIFSRDESKQFDLQQELKEYTNVRYLIGDIRDKQRLSYAMEDVDYIFHAAALKHVPACEYNPMEAVKTNVIGVQNLIEAAIEHNVEKVVAISTDKVVNPTNTMGATKLLSERLISAAQLVQR
ncbi:SDR family NAD(P)-dependent oxidoreductase [Paenibacillus sp. RC334]|uniref:SDR family NAD(P)-dependent oxidoreductase n=1 Tax=Paenibacillus sp. RC334 TaxID=3045840 RepID=UPI0024BAEBD0|nr:SDR family NAD(P)-dependent oxidoreductase [Paenibacillus sp. RC334]